MKKIIGFATQFYTLWHTEDVTCKVGDIIRHETKYYYLQNISTDIEKVKSLYPGVEIDMGLKGSSDFSIFIKEEFINPFTSLSNVIPFGKYKGKTIQSVFDTDIEYLVWLSDNSYNRGLREFCSEITTLYKNEKAEKQQLDYDAIPEYKEGEIVEFTVTFEKNLTTVNAGCYLNGLYQYSGAYWQEVDYDVSEGCCENEVTEIKLDNFAYYSFEHKPNLTINFIFSKEMVKLMRYNEFIYALPVNEKTGKGIKVKGATFKVIAKCSGIDYKATWKEQDFEVIKLLKL